MHPAVGYRAPLDIRQMTTIRVAFSGVKNILTVYEAQRPEVTPLSQEETLRRRPVEQGFAEKVGRRKSGEGDGRARRDTL